MLVSRKNPCRALVSRPDYDARVTAPSYRALPARVGYTATVTRDRLAVRVGIPSPVTDGVWLDADGNPITDADGHYIILAPG